MARSWLLLKWIFKPNTLFLCSFLTIGCTTSSRNGDEKKNNADNDPSTEFSVLTPHYNESLILNQTVRFSLEAKSAGATPDSIEIFAENMQMVTIRDSALSFSVPDLLRKVGSNNIRLKIFTKNGKNETHSLNVSVLSDIEPKVLQYEIIKTLPHDNSSYTQGLVFLNEILYESTGLTGRSKVRKIDPLTGSVVLDRKIDDEIFGEGITVYNHKLYQITYKSGVGFIYDPKSLEILQQFDLQIREGWGITTNRNSLIMSEGSSTLYYFDPVYFTLQHQIEVCDNKGPVSQLNELEYSPNALWANVYTQPYIIKIDETTGKVLATLNLENLFPKGMPDNYDHVLNGIAYRQPSNTYYITGKLWPLMYEIKIIEE
jgi:glutamine cyclotransferase